MAPLKSPLREWRTDRELLLEDAAKMFETTAATLSRVETGRSRGEDELEARIARVTGLSLEQLAVPRLERARAERDAKKKPDVEREVLAERA